jgi:very-short-patch-repair endonuclease
MSEDAVHRLLAAGEWRRAFRKVYALASWEPEWHQTLLAACLSAGPGVAASHRTAAVLWEMDGVERHGLEIVSGRRSRLCHSQLVVHTTRRPFVIHRRQGLPLTTPTRTLVDLSGVLSTRALELAVEDALRRGLTSVSKIQLALLEEAGKGTHGSRNLSRLVGERRMTMPASGSSLEVGVARALRKAHLPEPFRQYEVSDANGFRARLDFAYPEAKLAIEADGYRWHSGRKPWARDLARRNKLVELGWVVLHATKEDLENDCRTLAAVIRRHLGRKGS